MTYTQFMEPGGQRQIRVFVSSTFQDMQAEREELVKRVFPRIRKLCEARGIAWGEVDLRWGILNEEAAEGRVLQVCLAEIRHCNVFVGMLSERYGWVPDEISPEVAEAAPAIAALRARSVTELEIRHALQLGVHAFFYFRDPAFADRLPERERRAYRDEPDQAEIDRLGGLEANRKMAERHRRLAALKAAIRRTDLPVREGYPGPVALGDLVGRDLETLAERLFPSAETPDPVAREDAEHVAFGADRTRVYVGRTEELDALDAHADGDGPPLVVLAEPGGGKSALVSNWLARRRGREGELHVVHHVGASEASTDWVAMLRRLIMALRPHAGVPDPVPDDPQALREIWGPMLARAAAHQRVILVLDGVDHLDDREGAPDLVWLPREFPDRVRVVLTMSPGRSLAQCVRRGWPQLGVSPLAPDDRREFIRAYLAQYAKRLDPAMIDQIVRRPQTANPLYSRALLEELRLQGRHETLDAVIERYLSARDVATLYDCILARWEDDYERDRPHLVRDAFRLLWAARHGLSEPELLDLLGKGGAHLPHAHWSPFHLACEDSLLTRSGRLCLANDDLRKATQRRYLKTNAARRRAHLRLAAYFESQGMGPREIDELPWQLAEGRAWDRLVALLCEPAFLSAAWERDEFAVKRMWSRIQDESPYRLVDALRPALAAELDSRQQWTLAALLAGTGHGYAARDHWRALIAQHRDDLDPVNLQAALGNLALLEIDRGALDAALELLREQEDVCRSSAYAPGMQASLGYQAMIRQTRGQTTDALALLASQERFCREGGDRQALQACVGNQGMARYLQGEFRSALALFEEQERICREIGNADGLHASLSNRALVVQALGDLADAQALHAQVAKLCLEIGDLAGRQAALNNCALVLRQQGDMPGAMRMLQEVEDICLRLENPDGLRAALGHRALILQAQGDFAGALTLHREEERICREIGHVDGLQTSLGNQAHALLAQGALGAAANLTEEQERLCRDIDSLSGVQAALDTRGQILLAAGDFDAALEVLGDAERIARDLDYGEALQETLGHRAKGLIEKGCHDLALEVLREQEEICRTIGLAEGLARSLWLQGLALAGVGREAEAAQQISESVALATSCGLVVLARTIEQSRRA